MDYATHDADSEPTIHTTRVDWNSAQTPSSAVVDLVADAENVRPIDLAPLHGTVDPDALDRLFTPTPAGYERKDGYIVFVFEGYHVTIHGDGEITAKTVVRGE